MFGQSSDSNQQVSQSWTDLGDVQAFIGKEVEFKGSIRYQGTLRIDGRVEGEIQTDGKLEVGEGGVIGADIEAESVVSRGTIRGDLRASERVQLLAPSIVDGSIETPSLSVEDGVQVNGTIQMGGQGKGLRKPLLKNQKGKSLAKDSAQSTSRIAEHMG